MKIAITGHRPNKLNNDYELTGALTLKIKAKLQELIVNHRPSYMISGMALGIDTLWALLAIENNIKLLAAIPCKGQHTKWPDKSKINYMSIIANELTTVHNVSDKPYTSTCMQERNKWMVDNCDILVAVWDGSSGGTANCINYAKSVGKHIITLNLVRK